MRTLFCSILFLALGSCLTFGEAGQSVHLRPSVDSPIIGNVPQDGFFMAPADPVELTARQKEEGWKAISFLDDLRGFVRRTDLTKDLLVTPGAAVYASEVQNPSNILTRAHANDLFEVEKLAGDWVEVSFRKPITGYIGSGNEGRRATAAVTRSDLSILDDVPPEPQAPQQAPQNRVISNRAGIPTDGILRAYEGRLGQTRSFFGRSPPHEFQIMDASGNRIAYLDLSRLLITTPMEHFIGREFHFYGRAEAIEGRRDFVIRVEQMRRR